MSRPDLSVVLPVLNEQAVVPELIERLRGQFEGMDLDFELLFVDDGSTDDTLKVLGEAREADPRIKVVSFSRNFGHHQAVSAGIDHARGEAVVIMDADLQDQPEEFPKLWARYQEGYDLVFGVVDTRREPKLKALAGRAFWAVFSLLTGIKLKNPAAFRVASRRLILAMRKLPERSRFMPGLFHWVGFKQTSVVLVRGARTKGRSKYDLARLIALSLHAMTSLSRVPLRISIYLAMVMAFGAMSMAGWVLYQKLVLGGTLLGWASTMITLLVGFSLTFLLLGIIGEYLAVVLAETQGRPLYLVRETLGVEPDEDS